jgi:hypothetical protein
MIWKSRYDEVEEAFPGVGIGDVTRERPRRSKKRRRVQ